jgi:hypothetical protein
MPVNCATRLFHIRVPLNDHICGEQSVNMQSVPVNITDSVPITIVGLVNRPVIV